MSEAHCYHCQDVIPSGTDIHVDIDGESRPMCCHGCSAAAAFIAGAGLAQFYRHRESDDGASLRPPDCAYDEFDQPDIAQPFVAIDSDGVAEATLYIGDLYCPACIWLVNQLLDDQPGVLSVAANPASRRIVVRWRPDQVGLGGILQRIATAGFKPQPVVPGARMTAEREDYRKAIRRIVVAGVFGMQTMMFAIGLYAGEFHGMDVATVNLLRWASLVATLPIIGYAAVPFFRAAWIGIRQRAPGMDLPVAIALTVAFVASLTATLSGRGDVYFDSIAMFVGLLCISRFLEMRARHRADDRAEALASMLPAAVQRVAADGATELVSRDALRRSDLLQIERGDVVAADGVVTEGSLSVDESMLTGESEPVARQIGDRVLAGTTIRSGRAIIEAHATGAATQLGEIARLIERAQTDRGELQSTSDRLATVFVVALLVIAAATAVAWWFIAPARMLPVLLSVLIVACPCALALATPTALASAAGTLSRRGLLLVRARLIDKLQRGAVIVFDKTGTLTQGKPTLTGTQLIAAHATDPVRCRQMAAALEKGSTHVLARAFEPFTDPDCRLDSDAVVHIGQGISGSIGGREYRIGRYRFAAAISGEDPQPAASAGIYLADADGVLCRFEIADAVRDDALATINWLHNAGFETHIASGDQMPVVQRIAAQLGIAHYHADCSPASKLELIRRLRQTGKCVVMVGDGVNDAPVLAAADASIAIGSGTALARASADGILLGNDLRPLCELAVVSRLSRRIIRQSLTWAGLYNLSAVSLATLGFIAPWMAAIGMSASSLLVVVNALRINRVPRVTMTQDRAAATHGPAGGRQAAELRP